MGLSDSARAIFQATVWRATGSRKAGRSLVGAACSGDESAAALAGMALTRGGDNAVPLVAQAISDGAVDPTLFDILMSVGSESARAELRRIAASGAAEARATARESLRALDQMDAAPGEAPDGD